MRIGYDFCYECIVRFICFINYCLEGIDEIMCLNGRWSGRVFFCKGESLDCRSIDVFFQDFKKIMNFMRDLFYNYIIKVKVN